MAANRFSCDPNLTGNLVAEYTALQNDLEQARCLAVDYQNQLHDKSNDLASLKMALERTVKDLDKLQSHIVALREERHRLANEVMKVVFLESKVATLTNELAQFKQSQREQQNQREQEAQRDEQSRREQLAQREEQAQREQQRQRESRQVERDFIQVGFEEPESMTIIPTVPALRPAKLGR